MDHETINVKKKDVYLNVNFRIFGLAGLMLILIYALLSKGLYFRSELLTCLILIGVVLLFAVADVVLRGETDFFYFPVDYLLIGLTLFYLFSTYAAVSKPDAVVGVLKYTGYLAVFFIICQSVKTWRSYSFVLEVIGLGGIMVALIGLLTATGHLHYPGAYLSKQVLSTFQYQNALAIFALAVSLIYLSLWAADKNSPFKVLWYITGLLLLNIVLLGTDSRAVWIMYPFLLIVWVFGLSGEHRVGMAFNAAYVLTTSILVSRLFYARVESGQGQDALIILCGSLLVVLAGWIGIYRSNKMIKQKYTGHRVRLIWQIAGVAYLVVILIMYNTYVVNRLPGGWNAVLPNDVVTQIATVNSSDENFTSRAQFSKDAVGIIRDYPWLGTGAGGWAALFQKYKSIPYYTTEVHNNFVQVAVETGIPGFLVYCLVWLTTFYSGFRMFKHFRRSSHWPLVWGTLSVLLAIGVHSGFDFDLSLPTLSILTWMLFGLVRNSRILARRNSQKFSLTGVKRFIPLVLGFALAAVLMVLPYRLYKGTALGVAGAEAMKAGNIAAAEEKMRAAMMLDPYTGSYLSDIAKINLAKWNLLGREELLKQGLDMARQAVEKEPYNIKLKETLILCYISSGKIDEALEVVQQVTDDNPMEIKAYEMMANAGVQGAMYYLDKGSNEEALVYIDKVAGIPQRLEKVAGKVLNTGINGYRYAERLRMTPGLNLAVGQAYLLGGKFEEGVLLLKQVNANEEADKWLAAAFSVRGDAVNYNQLMEKWNREDGKFKGSVEQIKWFISHPKSK